MKYLKRTAAFGATACLLPLWCAAVQAQAPDWTVDQFKAQGTVSTTKTDNGGHAEFNEEHPADGLDLSTVPLIYQDGEYRLVLWNTVEVEDGAGASTDKAKIKVETTNGKFSVRVKGPTGCAGLKARISFLVKAYTLALGKVTGPDDMEIFAGSEENIIVVPVPGRSATASITASVGGASSTSSGTHTAPPSGISGSAMADLKLFQQEVTYGVDETALVEIPLSLVSENSYQLPNDGQQTHGVLGYSEGVLSAKPDSRNVKLTRSGAPSPKQKGAPNVTIDESRDEWVDVDGTGHGHSTYSYDLAHILSTTDYLFPVFALHSNTQLFQVSLQGSWSTNLTQQWTPSDAGDTTGAHSQEMPKGTPVKYDWIGIGSYWEGNPTGQQTKIITHDVKDNTDGVSATARYELMLHDEWEKGLTLLDNAMYPFQSVPYPVQQWNQEATAQSYEYSITGSAAIKATESLNLGFKLPALKSLGLDEASIDAGTGVNIETSIEGSVTFKPKITLQPGYASKPIIRIYSHHREFYLEQYAPSGYVGKQLEKTDTFADVSPGAPISPEWSTPYLYSPP